MAVPVVLAEAGVGAVGAVLARGAGGVTPDNKEIIIIILSGVTDLTELLATLCHRYRLLIHGHTHHLIQYIVISFIIQVLHQHNMGGMM